MPLACEKAGQCGLVGGVQEEETAGRSLTTHLLCKHEVKSVLFSKILNETIFKALLGQNYYNFKSMKALSHATIIF